MTTTEVATTRPATPKTISGVLQVMIPELARAVPKGMDGDRIARIVQTEIRKSRNAKAAGIAKQSLDDCTQESFAGALLTSAALGLEPGVNGECYLIPYRDNRRRVVECQLIIGYQGIVKLFWNHPRAARIDAQWVGSNDEFRYSKGLNPVLEHMPAPGDRGEPVFYYAIVEVTGAQPLWDVFTADEIKTLRRGKVGSSGDIKDPQHWMERKTALKQVLKLAPKTTRLDSALHLDDRPGTDLVRSQALALPPSIERTPDYIDGQVDDPTALDTPSEPIEIVMASKDQLGQLAQIREAEKWDAAGWHDYVQSVTGADVTEDKALTAEQAQRIVDLFNADAEK